MRFATLLFLASMGCVNAQSGQFLCTLDPACPSGLVCREGVCVTPTPILDASMSGDSGETNPDTMIGDTSVTDAFESPDAPSRASICARSGGRCFDFDSGDLPVVWTISSTSATDPAVTDVGFRGLSVHTEASDGSRAVIRTALPTSVDANYVSAWVRLVRPGSDGEVGVISLSNSMTSERLSFGHSGLEGRLSTSQAPGAAMCPFATDVWQCVEIQVTSSLATAWVDGTSAAIPPLLDPNRIGTLELGVQLGTGTSGTFAVDIDDVYLGPERVGCLPP